LEQQVPAVGDRFVREVITFILIGKDIGRLKVSLPLN